jgi:hypothetical protein
VKEIAGKRWEWTAYIIAGGTAEASPKQHRCAKSCGIGGLAGRAGGWISGGRDASAEADSKRFCNLLFLLSNSGCVKVVSLRFSRVESVSSELESMS